MPKSDTPATRRSARVASSSAGPAAVAAKPSVKSAATKPASKAKAEPKPKSKPKAEPKEVEKAAPAVETEAAPKSASKSAPKSAPKSAGKVDSSKAAPKSSSKSQAAAAVVEEAEAEAPATAQPVSSGKGPLKLGQTLPKITLEDNTGASVDVSTLAGEKGVVLFLYPKADTPGCTTQACGYRDAFDEIAEFGYDVYGLSKDKPAAQQKWITKKSLNYKLLADPESKLIKKLGAFVQPNNTKRSHFIFEKGTGKLVDAQLGVKPVDDPKNCLKFLKAHHA